MEKKYRTELDPKTKFLRIIALKNFSDVKAGDKGGLIGEEQNLSQEGDCWIYDNAEVWGDARVSENAKISGNAEIFGFAKVYGEACVSGDAKVYGSARISKNASVSGSAQVWGAAQVYGRACVYEHANVCDYAQIYDCANVCGNAWVFNNARLCGFAEASNGARIYGNVKLWANKKSWWIDTSIKDSKDYVILVIKDRFRLFPSDIKDIIDYFPFIEENYVKNIETIRQLYGEKI